MSGFCRIDYDGGIRVAPLIRVTNRASNKIQPERKHSAMQCRHRPNFPPFLHYPSRGNTCSRSKKMFSSTAIFRIAVCILLMTALPAHQALAEQEGIVLGFFKFTAGVISAYALHETGHAVAAGITDTKLDWGVGTYNQPLGFTERAENDSAGRLVHASGLTTQLIVSEVILQAESIDKNDNFVRGMMAWNVLNPIIYAMDYWFIRSTNIEEDNFYQGDIEGFEHYSSERTANLFAGAVAVLAAFQGYRYLKTQNWAPGWVMREDIQLHCRPHGDSGFSLNLELAF